MNDAKKTYNFMKIVLSICKIILSVYLIVTVWGVLHNDDDYED